MKTEMKDNSLITSQYNKPYKIFLLEMQSINKLIQDILQFAMNPPIVLNPITSHPTFSFCITFPFCNLSGVIEQTK